MLLQSVFSLVYWYIRPLFKWFLRKTTKLCELQRICYGEVSGAPRTLAIEKSIQLSRNVAIRNLLLLHEVKGNIYRKNLQYAIKTVLDTKKINPEVHIQFVKSFGKCIEQIWGYTNLINSVEDLRKTQYDFENEEHEEKLLKLWRLLLPQVPLESRITKQWQDIGFQGDDPKTDFRGMGMLGLENLLYFATEYTTVAQNMLSLSQHPKHGYTFAIVGINLTHLAYQLVKDGAAKSHIFNAIRSPPSIRTFHHLYCYLFIEFDKFWILSKPNNLMDFNFIRDQFEKNIRQFLSDPKTVFRINLAVEKI